MLSCAIIQGEAKSNVGEILNDWSYRQGKASLRTVESQAEAIELASSVAGYEALRRAGGMSLELSALRELPRALVKARIARGWTQERLAQELDMPKQQIQRYEATDYTSASLRRILEVGEALDIHFSATVKAGSTAGRAFELARSMAGYAAVEAVEHVENRIRLRRLTADEARKIFDDLCGTYYQLAPLHKSTSADEPGSMDHRLAVRRALRTLARKRGDLS
jgi:ribosome-binding protein aMBF1 (putative translation factor)